MLSTYSRTQYIHYTTPRTLLQPFIEKGDARLQDESLFTKIPAYPGKTSTFCIIPVDILHRLCYNIGINPKIPGFSESQVQLLCKTMK